MKTYEPMPVIPSYTDEALNDPAWGREVATLLLSIPAGYRQPAAAEYVVRAMETVTALETRSVRPLLEVWREIVAEIRAQLGL